MVHDMENDPNVFNNSYISCIKINGKPILPPLMTPERRREMARYRELAKGVEARMQRWGRRQCNTKSSSIDSGVTFSSSDQTPSEQHQGSPWGESSEYALNTTPDKNRVNLLVGECNDTRNAAITTFDFGSCQPTQTSNRQSTPRIEDSDSNAVATILNPEYSFFRTWDKVEVHGKDKEGKGRKTWKIPQHNATASELKESILQKWDDSKNSLLESNCRLVGEKCSIAAGGRGQETVPLNKQEFTEDEVLCPASEFIKYPSREILVRQNSLNEETRPVKICERAMDFTRSLNSEQPKTSYPTGKFGIALDEGNNTLDSSANNSGVRMNVLKGEKICLVDISLETRKISYASSNTSPSESQANNSSSKLNDYEESKTLVASPFTSPETGRVSTISNSTMQAFMHDSVDESASSVAMTSSTDLNQYMNVTGSSGNGSPGRDCCVLLPGEDPLQRSTALAFVAKSYPSRQELLLASLSDPSVENFSENDYQQNLRNAVQINDPDFNKDNTLSAEKPTQENDKQTSLEGSVIDVDNRTNFPSCNGEFHKTLNKNNLKCLTVPDVKLQDHKTSTGSSIPICKQLHSPLKSQIEDNTKLVVSPPKLVRQNSYTLESPSPLLIAHVESQTGNNLTHDMTENSNMSSKSSNKLSNFSQTKNDSKNRKGSLSSVSSSPYHRTMVTKKSNASVGGPYRNTFVTRPRNRQNSSLPASAASSPVKFKPPFISLDCLPTAISKEHCKIVTTPGKHKDSPKSRALLGKKNKDHVKVCQKSTPKKPIAKKLSKENISTKEDILNVSSKSNDKNIVIDSGNKTCDENNEDNLKILSSKDVGIKENCRQMVDGKNKLETESGCTVMPTNISQHDLVVRLQSEHSHQMARLLLKQKEDLEKMQKTFIEQQSRLMLEIYQMCPEIFSSYESERVITSRNTPSPIYVEHNTISSNRNDSKENTNCDTKAVSSNMPLNFSNVNAGDVSCDVLSNVSGPLLNTSAFEISNGGSGIQGGMQETSEWNQIRNSGGSLDGDNVMVQRPSSLTLSGNIATPRREEVNLQCSDRKLSHVSCSRQLFPALERKLQAPISREELEKAAATKITAAVKGYLTRRLYCTSRVQEIIQTIRDSLLCAVQINQECWPDITPQDVALHRRLIHQITAACHALHEVFFMFSTAEKMAIIAADRERFRSQAPKPPVPRPLSAATIRALERKMLQRVDVRPESAAPRLCRVRSAGSSVSTSGSFEGSQSSLMRQQAMNKMRRSLNVNGSRKPWR